MAPLQQRLDEFKRTSESGVPPYNARSEVIDTMHRAAAELKASGAEDVALTVGDRAPAFTFMNQDVVHVASGDLLRAGPLVVYESFGNALHRARRERFVKTGPHLSREELDPAGRSLARSPCLLETSRPGVFAVGDARSSRRSLNSTLEWRPRGTGIQVEKSSMFSKGAAGVRGRRKAAGDAQAGRRPLHPGRRGSRGEERRQPKRAEPATYIVEKVKPLLTEVGGRFPR